MNYASIEAAANADSLTIVGAFHPADEDNAPACTRTLLMLGPLEPAFWSTLKASPEYAAENPVDRWSERIISKLANDLSATALFPFGGPPYQPFISWGFRTGRIWQSPISLMIHDSAGLFLSFRGALAFAEKIDLPPVPAASPCETCTDRPCITACPAAALTEAGYDLDGCHDWLDAPSGKDCLNSGCIVRRACPVSRTYGRLEEQSAHHMRFFHKG